MADFGLALLAQPNCQSMTVEHTSGTIGYADPLYISTGQVTERSEVYSFGMVLLEVLTRRPPALQHTSGRIEFQFTHINGSLDAVRAMLDRHCGWPAQMVERLGKLALQCIGEQERRGLDHQTPARARAAPQCELTSPGLGPPRSFGRVLHSDRLPASSVLRGTAPQAVCDAWTQRMVMPKTEHNKMAARGQG